MENFIQIYYKNNSEEQINQLKKDLLMETSSSTGANTMSSFISNKIKESMNSKTWRIFEINVRNTLANEFNLIEMNPRHFFYRIITHKTVEYLICPMQNIIAKGKYIIKFDEKDQSCNFVDINNENNIYKTIKTKNDIEECIFIGNKFYINVPKEVEVDGIFKSNDFSLNDFNQEEIIIIYNNLNDKKFA